MSQVNSCTGQGKPVTCATHLSAKAVSPSCRSVLAQCGALYSAQNRDSQTGGPGDLEGNVFPDVLCLNPAHRGALRRDLAVRFVTTCFVAKGLRSLEALGGEGSSELKAGEVRGVDATSFFRPTQ